MKEKQNERKRRKDVERNRLAGDDHRVDPAPHLEDTDRSSYFIDVLRGIDDECDWGDQ